MHSGESRRQAMDRYSDYSMATYTHNKYATMGDSDIIHHSDSGRYEHAGWGGSTNDYTYEQRRRDAEEAMAAERMRARVSEQNTRLKLEATLGDLYDITHFRDAQTPRSRADFISRHIDSDSDSDGTDASMRLTRMTTKLAELRKERDNALAIFRSAVEWRFWASLPAADLRAIRSRVRPDNGVMQHRAVEAKKVCGAAVDALGTCPSLPDARAAYTSEELAPFTGIGTSSACPACSRALVERARADDGLKFIGCSDYPNCRFAWSPIWGMTMPSDPEDRPIATAAELRLAHALGTVFREQTRGQLRSELSLPNGEANSGKGALGSRRAWVQLLRDVCAGSNPAKRRYRFRDFTAQRAGADLSGEDRARLSALWTPWDDECSAEERAASSVKEVTAPCSSEKSLDKKVTVKQKESLMKDEAKVNGGSVLKGVVDVVVETTKEDGTDAAWRTAADEATEIAKPVAKQILREFGGTLAKPLIAKLDTPIGTGAVAWVTGWAIMGCGPLRGKELGPKTMRLSKELRVAGLKPLTDAVAKKFITPMRKRLTTLIEDLPALVGEG